MSNAKARDRRAIETTGTVDEAGRLHLDEPLEGAASQAVRVILLYENDGFEGDGEEIGERVWLRAGGRNPAFDFLSDPEEDIYTAEDGAPFDAEAEGDEDA